MTHPDDDTLLRFVLETLDAPDERATRDHVLACEECARRCRNLKAPIDRIASLRFGIQISAPPRLPRRPNVFRSLLKSAAILAVGFLLGYLTAGWSTSVPTLSVQQHLRPTPAGVTMSRFTPCEQVDLGVAQPLHVR